MRTSDFSFFTATNRTTDPIKLQADERDLQTQSEFFHHVNISRNIH
jgi:hypothetical protein